MIFHNLFVTGNYQDLASVLLNGDIIFGVSEVYWQTGQMIDEYRKREHLASVDEEKMILFQAEITDRIWDNYTGVTYKTDDAIQNSPKGSANFKRIQAYKALLKRHGKYNLLNFIDEDKSEKLSAEADSDISVDSDFGVWKRPVERRTMLWKKSSKAGLEYQIFYRRRVVHFLMDKILLEQVARKEAPQGNGVVASELRWLYRHRNMPIVKKYLWFWNDKGPLTHDEVFQNPSWSDYSPKHNYF